MGAAETVENVATGSTGRGIAARGAGPTAVAHLTPVRAPDSFYTRIGKPVFDRVVAALLLILTLPVMIVVAASVRLSIGSPVLFRQRRVGRDDVAFSVLKFRTMRPDRRGERWPVIEDRRTTHKTERDPRHTGLGRRLRRWSLDELPQLWNVVRGDMSLIGPRPELVEVVERYAPWQHQRHLVRPGITGLWQVSRRGDGMMHLYTDVDLEYVATVSFRRDLGILFRTIPAALSRSGV
jgi:lipopolysaccharide/colanic/teichoic acid biosynthesis glycosyltransferase